MDYIIAITDPVFQTAIDLGNNSGDSSNGGIWIVLGVLGVPTIPFALSEAKVK